MGTVTKNKSVQIGLLAVALVFAPSAWSASWVEVVKPADIGTKGQAGAEANGCYRIELQLDGSTFSDDRTFSLSTALISPHVNNCVSWTETVVLPANSNTLVIEAYSPLGLGDPNNKNITVNAAHGVDALSMDFPNSGVSNPPPPPPPPPPSGGGEGSASGQVLTHYVHSGGTDGEGVLLFRVANKSGGPSCSTAGSGQEFAIGLGKELGHAVLSTLLYAAAQGKSVQVLGTGACDDFSDREGVRYVLLSH